MYPIEWIVVASVPMLLWIALYAFCSARSRGGGLKVHINSFAIIGAFMALASFATGWCVVESGLDWSASSDMSFFLLFTYPVALITPLAGLGQIGILVWVLGFAQQHDASITPWPGYLLAWASAALMFAGMAWPSGFSGGQIRPGLSDRLLTLTARRPSGPWMPDNQALAAVLSVILVFAAAASLVLRGDIEAPLLMLVALVFVLYLLKVHPMTGKWRKTGGQARKEVVSLSPSASRMPSASGRSSMAWVLFVGASFVAMVVVIVVAAASFGSSGYSGEERTTALLKGVGVLAIALPAAFMAHRRAIEPRLPRGVMTATSVLFSIFMLMSAVALSDITMPVFHASGFLFLAGTVLVGIPLLFLQDEGREGATAGG